MKLGLNILFIFWSAYWVIVKTSSRTSMGEKKRKKEIMSLPPEYAHYLIVVIIEFFYHY